MTGSGRGQSEGVLCQYRHTECKGLLGERSLAVHSQCGCSRARGNGKERPGHTEADETMRGEEPRNSEVIDTEQFYKEHCGTWRLEEVKQGRRRSGRQLGQKSR